MDYFFSFFGRPRKPFLFHVLFGLGNFSKLGVREAIVTRCRVRTPRENRQVYRRIAMKNPFAPRYWDIDHSALTGFSHGLIQAHIGSPSVLKFCPHVFRCDEITEADTTFMIVLAHKETGSYGSLRYFPFRLFV